MYRPRQLGELLTRLCRQRHLSAARASRLAGLSVNQVRNIQRGLHRPGPAVVAAIAKALGIDERSAAEFRRLAGIDPDPSATPEAKAARRSAWAALTFVLANDILLPRLELLDRLDRNGPVAKLLTAAANAPRAASFVTAAGADTKPPLTLSRMLERFLGKLPERLITQYRRDIVGFDFAEGIAGTTHGPHHDLNHRVHLLAPLCASNVTLHELFDFVENFTFDRNFAVAYFPHLYWHACRCWPFEKVVLRFGLHPPEQQRRLYDAISAGMELADLDAALLGDGEIGRAIVHSGLARPSFEADTASPGMVGFEVEGGPTREHKYSYYGPSPTHDSIFDHLDRCEFLSRFPLLKIDRPHFVSRANSLDLPSWTLWKEVLKPHGRHVPAGAAPFGQSKCEDVISSEPFQLNRPADLLVQMLGAEFRTSAETLSAEDQWPRVRAAAELLDIDRRWLQIVQALAKRSPPGAL